MADKRATKRERRDEAKRRRLEELRRRQRQARLRKLAYAAVAGLVIAGIIAAVVFAGGDGKGPAELQRLASAAGCSTIEKHANEGSTHVAPPQTVDYKNNPPTSGNHYGSWADTGIHVAPIQDETQVHNLEHGHIVVQYKESLDPQILGALMAVVKGDPQWLVVAPSPTIPAQLTFTAWDHSQLCNTPTSPQAVTAALTGFIEEHKDNGPESIPGTPRAGTDTATPPASPSPTGTASPSPSPTSST